ncbi:MAG: PDDEXK nuclease domain-containing protein [bacterium]
MIRDRSRGVLPGDYPALLVEIKSRIRKAQYEALKVVNKSLIGLYWDIGRLIVERQKSESWGRSVVEKLAQDIRKDIGGMQGFSARNIWYMRNFYTLYSSRPKLQPLVAEIGWTRNLIIMGKCKTDSEREFYIRMAARFGWTKNVLALQIENRTYEKVLANQTNFDQVLPEEIKTQARLAVKDEYSFDFLELGNEHTEREMEHAILAKVENFLREMGGRFAFLGSQYRLQVSDQEYFIDLLLYHRGLRCLVAVELKVGPFKPEHVGKMQFYLAALDDLVRLRGERPSIGMIICRSKDRAVVEYALRESKKPIGIATYRLVRKLPKEYMGELPAPSQIESLLLSPES